MRVPVRVPDEWALKLFKWLKIGFFSEPPPLVLLTIAVARWLIKKSWCIKTNICVCRSVLLMQAKYWILTIAHHEYLPFLPKACCYIKGQLEKGNTTGYLHWQILCVFQKKVRLGTVKSTFGNAIHAEPSRSSAANDYVYKEDTAVPNTRFELGCLPFKRNSKQDWDKVKLYAQNNELDKIESDIYVRYYGSLKRIAKDHMCEVGDLDNVCGVWIWGPPGVGKSRKVRAEYQPLFSKMINKWWDGYKGEPFVLLDDFDKCHAVLGYHLKIWSDCYSFVAEQKGGAVRIRPQKIIVTSNYRIDEIFEDCMLVAALVRRFDVIHKSI